MNSGPEFHHLLLYYLKENTELTPYKLQEKSSVPSAHFAQWKSGRRPPSDRDLLKLASVKELGLTFEDLVMMRTKAKYGESFTTCPIPVEGVYKIPLLGAVSAGRLCIADTPDEIQEYIAFYDIQRFSGDLFALRVKGDSMEPRIPDGAILLCRRANSIQNKGVYVVETEEGETTVKLLQYEGTIPQLKPLNPKHKPLPLHDIKIRQIFEVLEYKVDIEGRTF